MLEDFLDIHEIERSFRKNIIIEYVVFNSLLIYLYQLGSILSNSFLENCKEFRIYQRLKWNGIVKLILDLSEYNSIETSNSMWMIMCLQGM